MDSFTGLLDGPKASGAFLLRSILNPPWALRIEDGAPLSLATMVRGEAWVLPDGGSPVRLRPGDVALMRGPAPYTLADDPGTPVQVVVGPDQRCSTGAGEDVTDARALGVRTWGDDSGGAAVLLSGTYQLDREIGRRLLGALPPLLIRPAGSGETALVGLLAEEIGRDEPGQELVLDRLLDLLLVNILRSWLAGPDSGAPGWYRAQGDPVVGPALRLLHGSPAHPWTVAALAARVGVSRAALARRFSELVGEPPMTYLSGWRLGLAADLLREPDATVARVAREVGYSSAFALSTAFKRLHGVSPQEYRKRERGTAPRVGTPPSPLTGPAVLTG
ncbi:AraC family transcriptional regulator [Streptomyces sp. N2-109]|uniref:AraC family transcriptional regulator n=1 Tax=Streptomyces gossypii TaxID=2883101 RepID=A0ABT2JQ23_9ACTN|nr:AraC family transcriptional regulator [Streptomyces gossypii]MCT2589979.1 AraC family transcriptional regulator [Streptomyces gossypii]